MYRKSIIQTNTGCRNFHCSNEVQEFGLNPVFSLVQYYSYYLTKK